MDGIIYYTYDNNAKGCSHWCLSREFEISACLRELIVAIREFDELDFEGGGRVERGCVVR